ncbi:uncharacterized protein [Procambarus clarkii]|uniref:uncharacterized protein n=1 Tax=Procambarus clarkii TaxID=6728 RepID=UPI0037445195
MALLLQGVTGGSRLSLTTPETLRGVHHLHHSGDTSGDDSNSGFLGRYDLEYPDDGLHDLTEVVEKRRYFLSDYQLDDFSLREAQQTFYKEYMKRPSLPEAEVLPPRNREEREGVDVSRSTTGISKHNESWVSKSATGAELKEVTSSPVRLKTAPSDPFSVEVPAAEGKDEAEDAPARVGDGGATRLIRSAEDLQQAGRPLCRSRENYLPPDLFSADACALCYHYLQNKDFFHTKWNQTDLLKTFSEGGRDYAFRITVLFNPYNESQVEKAVTSSEELKATFRGEVGHGKWISCCQAAEECCRHMLTAPSPPERNIERAQEKVRFLEVVDFLELLRRRAGTKDAAGIPRLDRDTEAMKEKTCRSRVSCSVNELGTKILKKPSCTLSPWA